MNNELDLDFVGDAGEIIRNMQLSLLENKPVKFSYEKYELPKKKKLNFFNKLFTDNRVRDELEFIFNSGAVLTGSQVLTRTKLKGEYLISRTTNDHDFLVTKNIMWVLLNKFNFNQKSSNMLRYNIVESDEYNSGGHHIDLIVVDKMPQTVKVGKYVYAHPLHILKEKYNIHIKRPNALSDHEGDLISFAKKFGKYTF